MGYVHPSEWSGQTRWKTSASLANWAENHTDRIRQETSQVQIIFSGACVPFNLAYYLTSMFIYLDYGVYRIMMHFQLPRGCTVPGVL